jgi:hypothetical protein
MASFLTVQWSGTVVPEVLLAVDDLFVVEQLVGRSDAHFIDDGRLKLHKNSGCDLFTCAWLREQGVERIIADIDRLVRRHLPVRLETVLDAGCLHQPFTICTHAYSARGDKISCILEK